MGMMGMMYAACSGVERGIIFSGEKSLLPNGTWILHTYTHACKHQENAAVSLSRDIRRKMQHSVDRWLLYTGRFS